MRNIVVYIAMSLDGYIADIHGGVSWITGDGSDKDHPGSYPKFIQTIDTVIMGYNTYHQITTELSPHTWVYTGKTSYVLTHKTIPSTEDIHFTDQPLDSILYALKKKPGKDIWICGGASVVHQCIKLGLIDRYHITIVPIILGDGVRLFHQQEHAIRLHLRSVKHYNGFTDLVYTPLFPSH